jgi:hypothetical protein
MCFSNANKYFIRMDRKNYYAAVSAVKSAILLRKETKSDEVYFGKCFE